jgi:sarcosine oxidase subunit beta
MGGAGYLTSDAVVIGGGVVGASLAYFLQRDGLDVTLLDRSGLASEASGSNYGMVWQQTRLPGLDLAMARRSLDLYAELVEDAFDIDIEYEKLGGMTVFTSPLQVEVMKKVIPQRQALGIPVRLISREECLDIEPNLTPDVVGATFCPDEAQLNPMKTTLAFAKAARRQGAKILAETAVTGIRTSNGRVHGVSTTRGDISAGIVINAAGAWASEVGKMAGIDVKVWPQRLQSMVTEPLEHLITRTLQGGRQVSQEDLDHPDAVFSFAVEMTETSAEDNLPRAPLQDSVFPYLKPTRNGNIVIGTTSEFAGHDKKTTAEAQNLIAQRAIRLLPALEKAYIIRSWSNFVPFTFDSLPLIGEVPSVKGLFLCCGHAHAFAHAPSTAEALTQLICDGHTAIDLTEADVSRYD